MGKARIEKEIVKAYFIVAYIDYHCPQWFNIPDKYADRLLLDDAVTKTDDWFSKLDKNKYESLVDSIRTGYEITYDGESFGIDSNPLCIQYDLAMRSINDWEVEAREGKRQPNPNRDRFANWLLVYNQVD